MLLLLLLLACGDGVALDTAASPSTTCDQEAELQAARDALERYTDVQAAMDDGYVAFDDTCTTNADGAVMGVHYARVADMLDDTLDPLQPEVLLYVPDGDGMRLVGVEYSQPALVDGEMVYGSDGDGAPFGVAPELFCRPLDGPMAGHTSLDPWHFDLHVWLFSDNPEGTFAHYNPEEDCEP